MALLERQVKIIRYLKQKNDFVKGSELAKILGVTDRTIRNDIIAIKNLLGDDIIISIKSHGYKYHEKEVIQSAFNDFDVTEPNNRIIYILKQLILSDYGVDIYDIADELGVSERTIEADITKLKKIILELELDSVYIKKEKSSYFLKGINRTLNNLLYDVSIYLNSDTEYYSFQKFFVNINVDFLKSFVYQAINKNHYKSKYLSINRLIIDLLLIIESINTYDKHYTEIFDETIKKNQELISDHLDIAREIGDAIKDNFATELNESDINYLAYLLYIKHKMNSIENEIRNEGIKQDDFYFFCLDVLKRLKDNYHLDLTKNQKLTNDFIFHVKVAIKRVELGIKLFNPLTEKLIKEYSYVIDLAVFVADMIYDKYHVKFDFNEISYIGVYLASSYHDDFKNIKSNNGINVLLYIPEGISVLNLIHQQIEELCSDINIHIDAITSLDYVDLNSICENNNLIITTSSRLNFLNEKIFKISKSLNSLELNDLKDRLCLEVDNTIGTKFLEISTNLIKPYLFFNNSDLQTKEEIIDFLCNNLLRMGYVNNEFKQCVYERENIVATYLDTGVAFPHSIKNIAYKTTLAVVFLNQAVVWNNNKVKYVFMLANSSHNTDDERLFIMNLVDALSNYEFVDNLKKCKDYASVIETFARFCTTNKNVQF